MFTRLLLSTFNGWILVLLFRFDGCTGKRMWDYEPLSIETTTTDPTKMDIDMRVERLGRGEFAFTGTAKWNYDADDTTMIEATSYRSSTGAEDDYKLLPWAIPKQTFKEYTKSYYKNVIYKNIEHCSNIPHPDNTDPFPRDTYKIDKCVINGEGMPDTLPEGYYKAIFTISGEVEWVIVVIIKIIVKNSMLG